MYNVKPWITGAALAPIMALSLALPGQAQDAGEPGRISVTGEATVHATPDIASVSLGVTTQAATAAEALSANTAALAKVVEQLKATGIEPRDLQTSNLSVDPVWSNSDANPQPQISGYSASNMLTVTVRDLDKLGAVLDRAVSDGANTLNGLSFGLSDSAKAMDEARQLAVKDALARAKLLTDAAGAQLGPIVLIQESPSYQVPQPMARASFMKADAAVPVERGQMGISAQVTMTWRLAE